MTPTDPAHGVILARIRMALRRATGQSFDVAELLSDPGVAAARLAEWRALGAPELNQLLDHYEHGREAGARKASPVAPGPATPASTARKAAAAPSTGEPLDDPSVPPDGPVPTDRRYMRGAR